MSCLSDVMDFFTHYVGPSARPINSHEVECFLGDLASPGFVSSSKSEVPPETGITILNEVKSDKHITTITGDYVINCILCGRPEKCVWMSSTQNTY